MRQNPTLPLERCPCATSPVVTLVPAHIWAPKITFSNEVSGSLWFLLLGMGLFRERTVCAGGIELPMALTFASQFLFLVLCCGSQICNIYELLCGLQLFSILPVHCIKVKNKQKHK